MLLSLQPNLIQNNLASRACWQVCCISGFPSCRSGFVHVEQGNLSFRPSNLKLPPARSKAQPRASINWGSYLGVNAGSYYLGSLLGSPDFWKLPDHCLDMAALVLPCHLPFTPPAAAALHMEDFIYQERMDLHHSKVDSMHGCSSSPPV